VKKPYIYLYNVFEINSYFHKLLLLLLLLLKLLLTFILFGTGLFPAFKVDENPIFSMKFNTCLAIFFFMDKIKIETFRIIIVLIKNLIIKI